MIWICLALAVAICAGLGLILWEDGPDNRVLPLSPEDEALRQHYLSAEKYRLADIRRQGPKNQHEWELTRSEILAQRGWRGIPIKPMKETA